MFVLGYFIHISFLATYFISVNSSPLFRSVEEAPSSSTSEMEGDDPLDVDDVPDMDKRILRKIFGKDYGTSQHTKEQLQSLANAQLDRLLSRSFLFFRDRRRGAKGDPIKQIYYSYYGDEGSAVITRLVFCAQCRLVMTTGGNVSRHLEKCKSAKNTKTTASSTATQGRIDGFVAKLSVNGTQEEQQQISSAVAKWVATSSRPFSIVEDAGFKEVISAAIKIGAKRRSVENFDVDSIVPTRKTVSNRLQTIQQELLAKCGAEVVRHLETVGGAFSADYGKRKDDYLTLVLHLVYEWQYFSVHVAMKRCDLVKKDNAQVWSDIVQAAKSFGLGERVLQDVFCASDEGSNITKALRLNNGKNVCCICHVASNLCKRTFSPYKNRKGLLFVNDLDDEEKELVRQARQILTELKVVVNSVRGTEIGHSLRKQLPLEVETRWLSKLKSAKAFQECSEELFKYKDRGKLPEDVKRALQYLYEKRQEFEDVLHILVQFEDFVLFFQKDDAVIHEVWPKWHELKECFNSINSTCDSQMQSALARSALKCMLRKEEDGVISKFHRMATLLNPKRRQLRKLATDAERKNVIRTLKDYVGDLAGRDTGGSQPKPPKVPRTEYDDLDESGDNIVSEVDSYLNASFNFRDSSGNTHDSPLIAWKERASDFPVLSRVVCQLYSIPASTATAERSFSDLRNLIPEKREAIGAESVFSSLVVRSLMKFDLSMNPH